MNGSICQNGNTSYRAGRRNKCLSALVVVLVCLMLFSQTALACPAFTGIQQVTDATGNELQVQFFGDEFLSYTTTLDGYLLYRNNLGYYSYVLTDGTAYLVGARVFEDVALQAQQELPQIQDDLQYVNVFEADAKLKQKLEAFYKQMSAAETQHNMTNSVQAETSDLLDYVPLEGVDPLYGKWQDRQYGYPNSPEKGPVCPLLVLKVQYNDTKCVFTDAEWHERVFGEKNSVSAYYNEVSNHNFTYAPAVETSDANDGVITVTLPITQPVMQDKYTGYNYDSGAQAGVYTSADGKKYAIYGNLSLYAYGLEAASQYIDFSLFDKLNDGYYNGNNDGYVSPTELAVLVVNAGYEASFGLAGVGDPATWATSWEANNFWMPDANSVYGDAGSVLLDGVKLYKYTIVGENLSGPVHGTSSRQYDYSKTREENEVQGNVPHQAIIGVVCHELGHDLGLHDLYDTTYTQQTREVGALSLMASGSWGLSKEELYDGNTDHGSIPSHLDAYSKLALGFYEAQTVSEEGMYTLAQAASPAEYSVLRVNTDDPDVYYLLENRQFSGFDAGMYSEYFNNQGGVVYWRIDERVIRDNAAYNQINTMPGQYGIMPEFVSYGIFPAQRIPFRNNVSIADYPEQASFVLPEMKSIALVCNDNIAPRMNVHLIDPTYVSDTSSVIRAVQQGEGDTEIWLTCNDLSGEDMLQVKPVESEQDFYALKLYTNGQSVIGAYDISLQSGNTDFQNGYLHFKVGAQYIGQTLTLLHRKANGEVEVFNATVNVMGEASFGPIRELSPFMLISGSGGIVAPPTSAIAVPKTGDAPIGANIGALLTACAAAVWTMRVRKWVR